LSEIAVAGIVFLCLMVGIYGGMHLRRVLPDHHISEESRQIVNVATGLLATLAALVLGLLVASAKSSFDVRADEIKQSAARIIVVDRNLRSYGPEAREARDVLRDLTQTRIDRTWGNQGVRTAGAVRNGVADSASIEKMQRLLWQLKPGTDPQRWLHAHALTVTEQLEQARWVLAEEDRSSIPTPFLIVLVFWLVVIFASLGLFAPRNATVHIVIFVCALSVSTAIFLVLEMDQPFDGLLQVSPAPLQTALEEMRLNQ